MDTHRITLRQLIDPLEPEAFFDGYWEGRAHHYQAGDNALATALLTVAPLTDLPWLCGVYGEPIPVWTPPHLTERVPHGYGRYVSPRVAFEFHQLGSTLFFEHVDRYIPALAPTLRGLERDLGLAPGSGYCSVFASRPGAGSRAHFDPEFNFCVQLLGTKRWRIHENEGITLPPIGMGILDPQVPELLRSCADLDRIGWNPDQARTLDIGPGDVLYFPPGCWHETQAQDACISAVFSFEPPSVLDAALSQVRRHADTMPPPSPTSQSTAAWLRSLSDALEQSPTTTEIER